MLKVVHSNQPLTVQPGFECAAGGRRLLTHSNNLFACVASPKMLTIANLFFLIFSMVSAAVPIRLYETVQKIEGGGPSNEISSGAAAYNQLTYNSQIPSGVAGYSYTWYHSTNDPTTFGVTFFSGQVTTSFSYISTLKWTNIKSAITSLYIPNKQLVAVGTYAGVAGQGLYLAPVTFNTQTISSAETTATAVATVEKANLFMYDSTTSYLFFMGISASATYLGRVDLSGYSGGAIPTTSTLSTFSFAQEGSIGEWMKISNYFIFWGSAQAQLHINSATDMTNANPEVTLTTTRTTNYAVLDHSSPTSTTVYTFYTVSDDSKVLEVQTLNLDATVASSTLTLTATTDVNQVDAYFFSRPVQVKNTALIALMTKTSAGNPTLRIYNTLSSLAEVATSLFAPVDFGATPEYRTHSLEAYKNHVDFPLQSPFVAQFGDFVKSFFLISDSCSIRNGGTSICSSCPAGYELTAANVADNECFPQDYQKLNGVLPTIPRSCDSPIANCAFCSTTDHTVCSGCDADIIVHTVAGVIAECYLTAAEIPAGYGKVTGSYSTATCKAGYNCATCREDYGKCETCNPGFTFLRTSAEVANLGDIDCLAANNVNGYGLDSGVLLKGCSITGCLKCLANYQDCTECQAPNPFLKIVGGGNPNTCVAANNIPGFGLDTAASVSTLQACSSSINCETCTDDYTSCLTCPRLATSAEVLRKVKPGLQVSHFP